MNISEAIKRLQELKEKWGDVPLYHETDGATREINEFDYFVMDPNWGEWPPDRIEAIG